MTQRRYQLLLTYTPRADVDPDTYHAYLRETDNPFFNGRPSVRRYTNWRVVAPKLGRCDFTHFDLLEIETADGYDVVFSDPEIVRFARGWVRRWGARPDPDLPDQSGNYQVMLCECVAAPEAIA